MLSESEDVDDVQEEEEMEKQEDEDIMDVQNNATSSSSIKRKKSSSPVWEVATQISEYLSKDSSTSNIIKHMQSVHSEKEEVKKMNKSLKEREGVKKQKIEKLKLQQPKLTSLGISQKKGPTLDSIESGKINEALVKYLIKNTRPFSDVNHPAFRELMFTANSRYICPDRRTISRQFDKIADQIQKNLYREIEEDVKNKDFHIITVVCDHGTSQDTLRTKKNVVIISRTTADFELKTDTLGLIPAVGEQKSIVIKQDMKDFLSKTINLDGSWRINWVTDGAAPMVKARNPSSFPNIGLFVHWDGTCVDHTFNLVGQDSLKAPGSWRMKDCVERMKMIVNHVASSSTARQILAEHVRSAGMDPLKTVRGTSNRFFTKFFEVDRFVELQIPITTFIEEYEFPERLAAGEFSEEDFELLETYRNSLQMVVKSSEILEGEKFVTASSVIPFLDSIYENLKEMESQLSGEKKDFVKSLKENLLKPARFKRDLYKTTPPYNALTLLDVRYGDLFFSEEEKKVAIEIIHQDAVYREDREREESEAAEGEGSGRGNQRSEGNTVNTNIRHVLSSVDKRRAELLAARVSEPESGGGGGNLMDKISSEIKQLIAITPQVSSVTDPMKFLKENKEKFPLIVRFWLAHSSFPATSCSAERVFNVDSLIITDHR